MEPRNAPPTYAKLLTNLQSQSQKADITESEAIDHLYIGRHRLLKMQLRANQRISDAISSLYTSKAEEVGSTKSSYVCADDIAICGYLDDEMLLPRNLVDFYSSDHMPVIVELKLIRAEPIQGTSISASLSSFAQLSESVVTTSQPAVANAACSPECKRPCSTDGVSGIGGGDDHPDIVDSESDSHIESESCAFFVHRCIDALLICNLAAFVYVWLQSEGESKTKAVEKQEEDELRPMYRGAGRVEDYHSVG